MTSPSASERAREIIRSLEADSSAFSHAIRTMHEEQRAQLQAALTPQPSRTRAYEQQQQQQQQQQQGLRSAPHYRQPYEITQPVLSSAQVAQSHSPIVSKLFQDSPSRLSNVTSPSKQQPQSSALSPSQISIRSPSTLNGHGPQSNVTSPSRYTTNGVISTSSLPSPSRNGVVSPARNGIDVSSSSTVISPSRRTHAVSQSQHHTPQSNRSQVTTPLSVSSSTQAFASARSPSLAALQQQQFEQEQKARLLQSLYAAAADINGLEASEDDVEPGDTSTWKALAQQTQPTQASEDDLEDSNAEQSDDVNDSHENDHDPEEEDNPDDTEGEIGDEESLAELEQLLSLIGNRTDPARGLQPAGSNTGSSSHSASRQQAHPLSDVASQGQEATAELGAAHEEQVELQSQIASERQVLSNLLTKLGLLHQQAEQLQKMSEFASRQQDALNDMLQNTHENAEQSEQEIESYQKKLENGQENDEDDDNEDENDENEEDEEDDGYNQQSHNPKPSTFTGAGDSDDALEDDDEAELEYEEELARNDKEAQEAEDDARFLNSLTNSSKADGEASIETWMRLLSGRQQLKEAEEDEEEEEEEDRLVEAAEAIRRATLQRKAREALYEQQQKQQKQHSHEANQDDDEEEDEDEEDEDEDDDYNYEEDDSDAFTSSAYQQSNDSSVSSSPSPRTARRQRAAPNRSNYATNGVSPSSGAARHYSNSNNGSPSSTSSSSHANNRLGGIPTLPASRWTAPLLSSTSSSSSSLSSSPYSSLSSSRASSASTFYSTAALGLAHPAAPSSRTWDNGRPATAVGGIRASTDLRLSQSSSAKSSRQSEDGNSVRRREAWKAASDDEARTTSAAHSDDSSSYYMRKRGPPSVADSSTDSLHVHPPSSLPSELPSPSASVRSLNASYVSEFENGDGDDVDLEVDESSVDSQIMRTHPVFLSFYGRTLLRQVLQETTPEMYQAREARRRGGVASVNGTQQDGKAAPLGYGRLGYQG